MPFIAVGLFAAVVNFQNRLRYEETYFTPEYQELYGTPGSVARKWEQALQTGDQTLVAELTGSREAPLIKPDPNITLTILVEADKAGYFHYLYFDLNTYRRSVYHFKEVRDRWVVVPEDAYFYWDSGQWLGVFTPIAAVWWLLSVVAGVGISLFRLGARARETLFRT